MFVAFEIYSAIGSDFIIYNIAVRAASTLCKSQRNLIHKFAEMEMLSFWRNLITDCTGRQLPVQPVMKISSKWYFRFSARASWIMLTFRADLVHVYITRCGNVYSYKKNHNTRPLCRPISFDFLHVSLFWIYVSNHMQTAPFHYCHSYQYMGYQMHGLLFGTSGYRWIEILISLNHYDISKSTYLSFIGKSNYRCHWTYIV